jgi:TolB protein
MNRASSLLFLVFECLAFLFCFQSRDVQAQTAASPIGLFDGRSMVGQADPRDKLEYDPAQHTYSIWAAGSNMWSTTDSFYFVWKKVSGDISLTSDVTFPASNGSSNPHRKAVLIFRQNLDADAVYADAALHGSGLTALQYRPEKGAQTHEIELTTAAPERLRIEKRGDTVTMFVSMAREPLHQAGASIKLHLEEPFYIGMGVCSHNQNVVETAIFSNVELKTPDPVDPAKLVLYSTLQTIDTRENFPSARVAYTARGRFEAPNWMKDGSSLLFNQDGKIMKVSAAGGNPEPLEIGPATHCNGSHGLSPDGKWLAISCSMPGMPESRVYVVPVAGGTPRLVTEHPNSYWHSWSPDGKTIVFTRPSHGSFTRPSRSSGNIYAIPAEGGEEKALTTGDGISDDPDCSPDGRYIYFNSDRSGQMEIWRMRPDGSEPEQITFDNLVNWTPHISPDGKSMVFLSYESGVTGHPTNKDIMLRIMSLEDKKVRVLVNLVGGSGTINVPSWAPDSHHLAFVSYQMLLPEDRATE